LVIIEIGAGEAVSTIRRFGDSISAKKSYARLIRINPRDTKVHNSRSISIPLGGLEGILKLLGI
jgi:intein-encoded DNA endonuclease-like protein